MHLVLTLSRMLRRIAWVRFPECFSIGALALTTLANTSAAQPNTPPPGENRSETFFGTVVSDPWRHLEHVDSPEVAVWMREQSARTRLALDALPGRSLLLERVAQIENGAPERIFSVERLPGERYRYLKRIPGDNGVRLYKRDGAKGRERMLVDLDPWVEETGRSHAFSFFSSSPRGRYLAYGLTEGGSEAALLRVMDTRTREDLIAPIDRVDLDSGESGDTGIGWLNDGSGFFFNRLAPDGAQRLASERFHWSQVFLRRIGDPDSARTPVFGGPAVPGSPGVRLEASDVPVVFVPPVESLAMGLVIHGTQREFSVYSAPLADVLAGRGTWQRLFGPEAKVTGMSMHGSDLFLLTYSGAPRFKVKRTSILNLDIAGAPTAYAPDRGILATIAAAKDGLYMKVRDGMISRLLRIAHTPGATPEAIALPIAGGFEMINPDARIPGVLIRLEAWNRAPTYFRYDPRRAKWTNDGLQPRGLFDTPEDIEVVETSAKSRDGTLVPLSIVHRKGVQLDGSNPTLLQGYGAYGSTDEPAFDPAQLAWLRHGGVNAICHVRGGGVHGREWYDAGRGATKPNTWKDGIACAEHLIAAGYTSSAKLAIFGGSAGGIFAGRAITERPDLFAAAVIQVGALDMVRSETTATGSQNIPEFGTVKTEPGFRALLEMSAYHHVVDGKKYPATLFIHGVNDARVDVWHSLKMAARLQAASAGLQNAGPALLRLDFDAGHGSGSTREQHWQELADMWSFILWQTGDPAFQP